MNAYSIIYIIMSIALLFVIMRTRLDLISVCAVCFIVYSIYCIPGIGISGFYRPRLSPALYIMVFCQLLLIALFSIITDKKERKQRELSVIEEKVDGKLSLNNKAREKRIEIAFFIYTVIIVLFALVNLIIVGWSTFTSGKENVWQKTNILYIISLYGTYPAFAYGIHKGKMWIWLPCVFVELSIFIAGSRAFLATMIVMLLCEYGSKQWKQHKLNSKIYIMGAIAIVFLLIYRMVDKKIMSGDIAGAFQTLSNPKVWKTALEFNEPRVIIANYDYVLAHKVRFPIGDTLYRFIDFIPGVTKVLPIHLSYPEYFSDWLMLEVNGSAGVGGTIWGESYAMFGYFGILLFTVIWLLFIRYCSKQLDYPQPGSYFIVSLGTYLAWYINRLDYNRVGQAFKVLLFCFILWDTIYIVLGGKFRIGKYSFGTRKYS